ncbi:hypothetical protein C2845_PM15G01530 [Panicum miliaceum]|uniref:Uncharacterized protein n=1 Tax=Panicum miliaceum TaxID=4540 RepID=A0A3L6QA63_PANMI|nr:hypothetical protein C2845_PM15G01530 [Panicum miliaceum]
MASPLDLQPGLDFQSFIWRKLGLPINVRAGLERESFVLVVSFGRCKLHLSVFSWCISCSLLSVISLSCTFNFGEIVDQIVSESSELLVRRSIVLGLLSLINDHKVSLMQSEDFQGESWTIQCEVIHDDLLGGLPPNEDQMSVDPLQRDAPFDYFGHDQVGPGPVDDEQGGDLANAPQNQVGAAQNEANADWELWPDSQPNLALNLAVPPPNPELDLNELPADQDMAINGGEIFIP